MSVYGPNWQQVEGVPWVFVAPHPRGMQGFCQVCGIGGVHPDIEQFIDQHAAHQSESWTHYGLGDAITRVSERLGFRHCTPCEARRRALNQAVPRMPFFRR